MNNKLTRRRLLTGASAAGAAAALAPLAATSALAAPNSAEPFRYCLNTSTIRGQMLSLPQEIEIAAKAGYQAIEPWIREIDQYVAGGGSLGDLKKRITDAGLTVESAIGFAEWIVDDDARRAKGLEEAKRNMDLLVQIGGKRLAAPPTGATKEPMKDLLAIAGRYRALLELGDSMGIVPQAEVWGFSQTLSRLGETTFVAIESGHPKACLLPDVYHIFKGGSDFTGLKLLSSAAVHVFHMNDYPAQPPRAEINDSYRVYPGDGIAPLTSILRDLHASGFRGVLSLELFNKQYWQQDAFQVARTGLEKMRESVARALG
jgi:sugar phosphate isomerase/epimerase